MGHIVVGLDESVGAAHALRWAVREGELHGWPVTAVLAWGYLDQHHADVEAPFDPSYSEADALQALDAFVTAAVGPVAAPLVERRAVSELAAPGLLEAAVDADLLVVGARGLGGFRELLLGSVSQQCLHHATCPVAVVRQAETDRGSAPERIVVGVDGSATAQRALDWALEEARLRHAGVHVVHAWHFPYVDGSPFAPGVFDPTVFEADAREVLDRAVAAADTRGLAMPVERIVVSDGAAQAVLDAARGADLVVMGSRGRGGFKGLVLGSVSHQVTHHAGCPVVVLPPVA